jgi:hypothetical protein
MEPYVRFEICLDQPDADPFCPCGASFEDSEEALAELRMEQERFPAAYLARVIYERIPESQLDMPMLH